MIFADVEAIPLASSMQAVARMKQSTLIWAASGFVAGALLTRWQLARWFTEEPDYDVEQRAGSIELRLYPRTIRAETTVQAASWEEALDEGFRRLARYIFGGNHRRQIAALGESVRSIDAESPSRSGERIHMTAPVTVRVVHPANADEELSAYTITFTMPKSRAPRTLPVPEDRRVHLRAVPARRVAVLRYRGGHSYDKVREYSGYLQEVLQRAGLSTRGEPEFAGYDPPSTVPWLRRNEIWLELGSAPQRKSLDSVAPKRAVPNGSVVANGNGASASADSEYT